MQVCLSRCLSNISSKNVEFEEGPHGGRANWIEQECLSYYWSKGSSNPLETQIRSCNPDEPGFFQLYRYTCHSIDLRILQNNVASWTRNAFLWWLGPFLNPAFLQRWGLFGLALLHIRFGPHTQRCRRSRWNLSTPVQCFVIALQLFEPLWATHSAESWTPVPCDALLFSDLFCEQWIEIVQTQIGPFAHAARFPRPTPTYVIC